MVIISIPRPHRYWEIPNDDSRKVAISGTEVTVEQFLQFRPGHRYDKDASQEGAYPVNSIAACDVMEFCNWLSESEEIGEREQCFMRTHHVAESDMTQWTVPQDFALRGGYRVLDDVEWQAVADPESDFVIRANDDRRLLAHYARYAANSEGRLEPSGSLLPNRYGLYDLYGNAAEWMLRKPTSTTAVLDPVEMLHAGGGITSPSWRLEEDHGATDEVPFEYVGLRVARTVSPALSEIWADAIDLAFQREWQASWDRFEQFSLACTHNPMALANRILLSARLGDEAACESLREDILRLPAAINDKHRAHAVALVLSVIPTASSDWAAVRKIAEIAATDEDYPFIRSRAYMHVREGQHELARDLLNKLEEVDFRTGLVLILLLQALNNQALGQAEDAQRWLAAADGLYKDIAAVADSKGDRRLWRGRILCEVLFPEVRAKVVPEGP